MNKFIHDGEFWYSISGVCASVGVKLSRNTINNLSDIIGCEVRKVRGPHNVLTKCVNADGVDTLAAYCEKVKAELDVFNAPAIAKLNGHDVRVYCIDGHTWYHGHDVTMAFGAPNKNAWISKHVSKFNRRILCQHHLINRGGMEELARWKDLTIDLTHPVIIPQHKQPEPRIKNTVSFLDVKIIDDTTVEIQNNGQAVGYYLFFRRMGQWQYRGLGGFDDTTLDESLGFTRKNNQAIIKLIPMLMKQEGMK